ncbi:MAG: amidase family protein, partial [Acidimicrobiales bacterium]
VRTLAAAPGIDEAGARARRQAGLELIDVELAGWRTAHGAAIDVLLGEALEVHRDLVEDHLGDLGADLQVRFAQALAMPPGALERARAHRRVWREELAAQLGRVDLLALPAMLGFPVRLDGDEAVMPNSAAAAVNLAGHPALAVPVATDGPLPASLQLIGPDGSEDRLLAAGALVEAAQP